MEKFFSENKIVFVILIAGVIIAGIFYFNKQGAQKTSDQKTFIETYDYIFDIPSLVGKSANEIKVALIPGIGETRLEPYIKTKNEISNNIKNDEVFENMCDELDFLYCNSMLFDRYNYFLEVEYKDSGKVGCIRLRYNSNSEKELLAAGNIRSDYRNDPYFEITLDTWLNGEPTIYSGLSFCLRSE